MIPPRLLPCRRFPGILLLFLAFAPGCATAAQEVASLEHAAAGNEPAFATSRSDTAPPASTRSEQLGPTASHGPEDAPSGPPVGAEPRAPELPVVLNDRVKAVLESFQRRRSILTRAFQRARRYVAMMRGIFREKGLPEDLVNLTFIESEVDPHATSGANAAGIWQFIPSTARRYGMRTGVWLDERRDPEKSTRGAAEHLRLLYARFGSWPLALAAYNAGEAAVQRAIDEQRTRDFWRLRLPKETQRLVPAFMAMTIISRDPARYGFSPPPEEPYDTDLLHLEHPTEIRLIARAAGTSVKHLRDLNPELVRSATPPDHPRYAVRIPRGLAQAVHDALGRIPPEKRVGWISHRVGKGETLAALGKRYQVSVQTLREMNDLTDGESLRPGRLIAVPTGGSPPA